ncbi:MAG: primosomal protein N' [Treponema sp.]|jgi:primosomal protein N' (replication factor Y)|nr:primosomal protein N' [Treponema sp.]
MTPYLELVFNVPLDQRFTYLRGTQTEAVLGKRAWAPLGKREALGYIVGETLALPQGIEPERLKPVRRVVDKEPLFDAGDIELAQWMAGYYFCGIGEALGAMIPAGKRAASILSFPGEVDGEPVPALSEEQRSALEVLTSPWDGASAPEGRLGTPPGASLFYLYGITGSGKTEVFLQAAERMLRLGKSVIYLVPEISLTHQTAEIIGRRFGAVAATIHSGMSPSARLAQWVRIRRGEARIVAGPRSAVFAPVRDLGLIIIDEEQDGSYKSGNTPRYHARQVAMHRCAAGKARLVMGSATPSAEAWHLIQAGRIRRLDLTRRLAGGGIPDIRPISLEHANGCLSRELKEEIRRTASMGRQTILFLNRRGFGYFYHCRSCGYELTCRNCSVSLTYHKSRQRALCHYCGYSTPPPAACPQCGSLEAGFIGLGTELIEEEARRTFPELRIRRLDTDSLDRKGSLEEALDQFRRGDIDILLGTQMVAKGLNFPGVRLVGVVLADMGLQLPDFRAAERAFSLIVQVAGRAGRFFPDGLVLVQTLRPHDPAIQRACALDVAGFYTDELIHRKVLGFPPYSRLIRFTIRGRNVQRADRAIQRLAAIAGPLLPPDAGALGPAECPIGLIAGNYRRHLILRGPAMGPLHGAAGAIISQYETGKDAQVYLETDVDPVSLL